MKTLCGIILAAVVALSAHGAFDVRDFGAEGGGVDIGCYERQSDGFIITVR